jgi:hypothetical protein
MNELLYPDRRIPKLSRFDQEVRIALGPRTWDGKEEKQIFGFELVLPAGTAVGALASYQHKAFVNDLILSKLDPQALDARLTKQFGDAGAKRITADLRSVAADIAKDPEQLVEAMRRYRNCSRSTAPTADVENGGHRFGEGLSDADKESADRFRCDAMREAKMLRPRDLLAPVVMATAIFASGCNEKPPAGIKFGTYQAGYASKPDLARVEHEFPLARVDLAKLTPAMLKEYDQEQIDQIYARLTAGPIPDGSYKGDLFFPKGISGERRIREIVGGLTGLAADVGTAKVEILGRHLWRGKVFYRDQRVLRNRIEDTSVLKPLIDGDLSAIPKVKVGNEEQWLMFPARLYCGQSLLDSRRESVIIDYFYTDEIDGYRERPDFLAGRRGRRCGMRSAWCDRLLPRPRLLGKIFLLNFTLENKVADKGTDAFVSGGLVVEDCWIGTSNVLPRRRASAHMDNTVLRRRWRQPPWQCYAATTGLAATAIMMSLLCGAPGAVASTWAVDLSLPGLQPHRRRRVALRRNHRRRRAVSLRGAGAQDRTSDRLRAAAARSRC